MSRWRISNKRMPRGQLAGVRKFMRGPERLSARSVTIPIESDPQRAADVAGGLAGDQVRSFEMWWDAAESRLRFVIISDERDTGDFERAFRVMYPNAAFDGMSETVPAWFDRRSEYRVFDVGTRHGHYATIFDGPGASSLITRMAGAIQSAGHAWLQFVFARFDCTPFLRAHMSRLDGRFAEINRGEYTSWGDEITGRKPRRHPELGYDLTSSYKGLKKHAKNMVDNMVGASFAPFLSAVTLYVGWTHVSNAPMPSLEEWVSVLGIVTLAGLWPLILAPFLSNVTGSIQGAVQTAVISSSTMAMQIGMGGAVGAASGAGGAASGGLGGPLRGLAMGAGRGAVGSMPEVDELVKGGKSAGALVGAGSNAAGNPVPGSGPDGFSPERSGAGAR